MLSAVLVGTVPVPRWPTRSAGAGAAANPLELEEAYDVILEGTETLLERAALLMDQNFGDGPAGGRSAAPTPVTVQSALSPQPAAAWSAPRSPSKQVQVTHAHNIERPQLTFPDKVGCPLLLRPLRFRGPSHHTAL